MKTLVVVDLQKDFYAPDGRLSVNGADVLPAKVAAAVADYDAVIFTLDWHPFNHCSFAPQGGPWPEHCVRFTDGASLPFEVVSAAYAAGCKVMYYFKGQDPGTEEYGAFLNTPEEQLAVLEASSQIVVCGLCGDSCVGESAKNLVALGFGDKLAADLSLTGSIDDGSTFRGIVSEYNLKTI